MDVKVGLIPENLELELFEIHDAITSYFNKDRSKNKRLSIILSNSINIIYEKKYDQNKCKIDEGYFNIKEEVFMNSSKSKKSNERINSSNKIKNLRIQDINKDIMNDKLKPIKDASSHWDSYTDENYHDNYSDVYQDQYGDNSYYHDSYKDAFEQPKKLLKEKNKK